MKRPCEDSSSAESDVGRETVYPGHMKASYVRCVSPTTTMQVMARKKRRGVIEKRRRDRINNSLSELRHLVPSALEKQGSSKLEKAEILQMTVDHLKVLQATGGRGFLVAHTAALDFLSLGFRECVAEVSRYLSAVEGLDTSDLLRTRLLSHLTSCIIQHDAAALIVTPLPPQQLPHLLPHPSHPHHWAGAVAAAFRPAYRLNSLPASPEAGCAPPMRADMSQRSVATSASSPPSTSLLSLSTSFPASLHGELPIIPPSSFTSTISPPISSPSSSQTCRPWGTEVGAF